MLTDAGVDVLILDFTNGTLYPEAWDALFETMTAMKKEGNVVPKICFWGYNNGANTVPKCVDKSTITTMPKASTKICGSIGTANRYCFIMRMKHILPM